MKKLLFLLFVISFWVFLTSGALTQDSPITPNIGLNRPSYVPGTWGEDVDENWLKIDSLFPGGSISASISRVTFANLPVSPTANQAVVITDGVPGSCASGGGTAEVLCQWNGSAWVAISGAGHTIENEGVALTQRTPLNFTGAGVDCADSGGKTTCTITGAALSIAGTGVVVQPSAGTFEVRNITGTAGNVTVTDGGGISGNPVVDVGPTVVQTDTATTYGAFNQNFGLASVTLPNSAGASPGSANQIAVDTTANAAKINLGGTVKTLATTDGTFDAFASDPVGCTLANGEWTNDINNTGISNCVRIISVGASAPPANSCRYDGDLYIDTRTYDAATGAGRTYRCRVAGETPTAIAAEQDGYTAFTADTGAVAPSGLDTIKFEGIPSGGLSLATIVTAASSSAPDKIAFYSKVITHDTDCTAVTTGKDGQLCYEKDSDTLYACEPTAGDCDTASEWRVISGGGGGGSPGGSNNDIQYRIDATTFGGGRCTMTTGSNISCDGSITSGAGGATAGSIEMFGNTSGSAKIQVAAIAGSPTAIQLPIATGTPNQALITDGGTPQQTSWANLSSIAGTAALSQLPASVKSKPCELPVGSPGAAAPVLADDDDTPQICHNTTGATLTITEVRCYAPVGSPTVTPIVTGGAATSILTGALTCTNAAGGASGTLNGTPVQLNGETLDFNITAAGGAAKYIKILVGRTL